MIKQIICNLKFRINVFVVRLSGNLKHKRNIHWKKQKTD